MNKTLLHTTTIIAVLAAVGLGLWLVNINFPASRQLTAVMELGVDQPMISRLGPEPRLRLVKDYQAVLEGPVYFDLRAPRWFNRAQITVVYGEQGRRLVGLGGLVTKPWSYLIQTPIVVIDLGAGWQQAIFEFDLNQLLSEKNVKRFILDTVGETGEVLQIRSITVTLGR